MLKDKNYEMLHVRIPGVDLVAKIISDDVPNLTTKRGDIMLIERRPTANAGDIVLVNKIETLESMICSFQEDGDYFHLFTAIAEPYKVTEWNDLEEEYVRKEEFDDYFEIIGRVVEIRRPLSEDFARDYEI